MKYRNILDTRNLMLLIAALAFFNFGGIAHATSTTTNVVKKVDGALGVGGQNTVRKNVNLAPTVKSNSWQVKDATKTLNTSQSSSQSASGVVQGGFYRPNKAPSPQKKKDTQVLNSEVNKVNSSTLATLPNANKGSIQTSVDKLKAGYGSLSPAEKSKVGAAIANGQRIVDNAAVVKKLDKAKITPNSQQNENLKRFVKKVPSNAKSTVDLKKLPNDGLAAQASSKAKSIPGSKAVYEKQIDSKGKTIQSTKTTYNQNGKIVHVKDKLNGNQY